MTASRDPRAFLPLTPLAFHVLLALANRPLHGYGIILDVDESTDGLIRLRTGTLYVLLQRLVEERLIELAERPAKDADARRRYYKLTSLGRAVLQAEARRLDAVVGDAHRKHVLTRTSKV